MSAAPLRLLVLCDDRVCPRGAAHSIAALTAGAPDVRVEVLVEIRLRSWWAAQALADPTDAFIVFDLEALQIDAKAVGERHLDTIICQLAELGVPASGSALGLDAQQFVRGRIRSSLPPSIVAVLRHRVGMLQRLGLANVQRCCRRHGAPYRMVLVTAT